MSEQVTTTNYILTIKESTFDSYFQYFDNEDNDMTDYYI